MNAPTSITAQVDAQTVALVEELARAHGQSSADLAANAIRRVAADGAEFRAFLKVGEDAFARGDCLTHKDFAAEIGEWQARKRAD